MIYSLEISEKLDKTFSKLFKKDKLQFEILTKKLDALVENPHQFKPLKADMSGQRRVHIGKSFVLTFEILEKKRIVRLLDYEHHDKIYKK
jgi:YafQ family addiction module toxin component